MDRYEVRNVLSFKKRNPFSNNISSSERIIQKMHDKITDSFLSEQNIGEEIGNPISRPFPRSSKFFRSESANRPYDDIDNKAEQGLARRGKPRVENRAGQLVERSLMLRPHTAAGSRSLHVIPTCCNRYCSLDSS